MNFYFRLGRSIGVSVPWWLAWIPLLIWLTGLAIVLMGYVVVMICIGIWQLTAMLIRKVWPPEPSLPVRVRTESQSRHVGPGRPRHSVADPGELVTLVDRAIKAVDVLESEAFQRIAAGTGQPLSKVVDVVNRARRSGVPMAELARLAELTKAGDKAAERRFDELMRPPC
jgi:hypothetical protein